MSSYIVCYDTFGIKTCDYIAPFDVEVNEHRIYVYGNNLRVMVLRGKCGKLIFVDVKDYNEVDLSGFMDLEVGKVVVGRFDKGLLKILELNCKTVNCIDEKLEQIMNKYMKESDPLMRDVEGFKLEMAVNGYGNKL